jgi:hypothetical protein
MTLPTNPNSSPELTEVESLLAHLEEQTQRRRCASITDDEIALLRQALSSKNELPSRMLNELLAVIHRDGGHYIAEHGLQKAFDDAMQLSAERLPNELPSEVELLRDCRANFWVGRSALQGQQEFLDHTWARLCKITDALNPKDTGQGDHLHPL